MKPLILLIAGSGQDRTLRALALESQGWHVQEADSVAALLTLARRPDVVLLEVSTSLEELVPEGALRRAWESLGVPLLVMASAAEQERLVRQGLRAIFLGRPLSVGAMVEAVRVILPPEAQASPSARRPTVLIADDDPVSRKLLMLSLAPFHFDVVTAGDGQAALDLARRRQPDVVVCDVLMPRMDGFRMCLALRKEPRLAHVPVILTHVGAPDELDLRMAQNVGANAFVRRTQEGDELLAALLRELHLGGSVPSLSDAGPSVEEHLFGMVRRLERQVGLLAQAERTARESEERYRLIIAGSYDGVWDWDLRRRSFWCSPRLLEMLGLTAASSPGTYEVFVERLHPDDREAVVNALSAHLERDIPYDVSYRLRHANGGYRACVSRGRALRDAEGRPVRMTGIIGDVTEQLRLYRETQEAVRTRDEFLAVAAHELRTPLTALRLRLQGVAQALRADTPSSPERMVQVLEAADRQVGRLASLVDTLLDVSQLQNQGPRLELEDLDLASVVRETVARSEQEALRAGCQLVLSPLPSTVGKWDRVRLAQVIRHLLANAVKFGPGKPVEVLLESQPDEVVLQVRDHGIGIAPERLEGLFKRFERAVSARHYGGLGLGLYRVRSIVEAHGGVVSVASVPGEGSTFRVHLPVGGAAVIPVHSIRA
ncbi:hybrid sensor histidine kinase/response regulator [Hyalangium rubrum]|uniref:histidine kinase n=1 Tax=Hyalangium rubrum TaxID=3103134 RepID=A0ABU5H947_9BACT|nr:hybrid sensor histidine kinase/response regulator [Hyalangium sp. s54d21]MDY7230012.1 hybrid sensor histidine kinase/response regulator [Hyalangium sp. s54d21]